MNKSERLRAALLVGWIVVRSALIVGAILGIMWAADAAGIPM